jgi:hypothetical protein
MMWRDDKKLAPVRQSWREWIHQNEDTRTCKGVLARDRHFDRSGQVKQSITKWTDGQVAVYRVQLGFADFLDPDPTLL